MMPDPPSKPDDSPPFPLGRVTVAEYRALIASGVLEGERRCELLEGRIVVEPIKTPLECTAMSLGNEAFHALSTPGWFPRVRVSVEMADSLASPSLSIVRGKPRDYPDRYPCPADVALVIEVAESSLAVDRGLKARIYARAGIPAYWIVNLMDQRIEVHTQPSGPAETPTYARVEAVGPEGSLPLMLDGVEIGPVAARDLLP